MISFVNAKLNLGLSIVSRRPDGYHNLETLFYPVGRFNGTPQNPSPFCDMLEITTLDSTQADDRILFSGRPMDCDPEKNLVTRALHLFRESLDEKGLSSSLPPVEIRLEKYLPDGAGLGGGSADASFTLRMLNSLANSPFPDDKLLFLALRLGADCPFFILNVPAFASGIGERLEPSRLDLSGWWALIVKPAVYVSTKEAFAGIKPSPAPFDLRHLPELPPERWKDLVVNDFESTIFPLHPELREIKEALYGSGAVYASMSGSGSSIFGLYSSQTEAQRAFTLLEASGAGSCFLCLL